MSDDITRNIYNDALLRYSIIFAHKMIADGHQVPDDLNQAIIAGIHQHGLSADRVQEAMQTVLLHYVTQGHLPRQ